MRFEIKPPREDAGEFCEICSRLKNRGIYVEVSQEGIVVSGSSLIGMLMLDPEKKTEFMTRQLIPEDDMKLLEKWKA